jgi:hypothetical protein
MVVSSILRTSSFLFSASVFGSRARSRLTGSFTRRNLTVLINGFNYSSQNTSSTGMFVMVVVAGSVIIIVLSHSYLFYYLDFSLFTNLKKEMD